MMSSHILLVRPAAFGYNAQTAVNNAFQQASNSATTSQKALKEFDGLVSLLRNHNVGVTVVEDSAVPPTPDAVFPNNWISFHEEGSVVQYPMFAPNRRPERENQVMEIIGASFYIRSIIDLTYFEQQALFLEGTGSMVLDRDRKLAYSCLSPRTDATPLYGFCQAMGYKPVIFYAYDPKGTPIYHTNVLMCMADTYVVICLDSITDITQKQMLLQKFEETGKTLIDITPDQMMEFAGNMLQVCNTEGDPLLVMSTRAFKSLSPQQITLLESFNPLIHTPLHTIEQHGGGSARCMMAEVFLPPKI